MKTIFLVSNIHEAKRIQMSYDLLQEAPLFSFPAKGMLDISCELGVYIIYDPEDKVLHIGRTLFGRRGLCQRLNNHLYNRSSFTREYLKGNAKLLRNGYRFSFLIVPNSRERALLEYLAIGKLCPLHLGLSDLKQI